MKIIIVGGGIGGLTTAIALQQRGFEAHVYEASAELRPVGKGIWLPTNAMLIMERLGLADALAAQGVALSRIEVHDARAGLLQRLDLEAVEARFGRTTTSILRADLQATLAAALADGTLHMGKRCVGVSDDGDDATATFDDGSHATSDLIVGADGIRSTVRAAIVPHVPLRYAGQQCYLGVSDFWLPDDSFRTVREIWGGAYRFGYSAVRRARVYWFAPVTTSADTPLPADPVSFLHAAYRDFPAPVGEILGATVPDNVMRVLLNDIAPQSRWYRGRVVLVGDAAHAMTPNLGQGGAQAIEDGAALAQLLDESDSAEHALAAYQALRLPRAHRIAGLAWRLGRTAHIASSPARALRNTALKLLPDRINQRQVESLYALDF